MRRLFLILSIFSVISFANTFDQIKSKNEIRIGVRKAFAPLGSYDGSNFVGFEVELAKSISKKVFGDNIKITFIGIDAKDRIPMLEKNQVDLVMAAFAVNNQRRAKVDFSIPYLTTNMSVLSKDSGSLKQLSDFKGKRLLYIKGTTNDAYIQENPVMFSSMNLITCENLNDCFNNLKAGKADGIFHVILSLGAIPILDSRYTITVPIVGNHDFVAAAVSKGNNKLLDAVNDSIFKLSSEGFFKKAYESTFTVYYKGTLDKKYFLLDDVYRQFMLN